MVKLIGHRCVVVANVATHWHRDLFASLIMISVMVVAAAGKVNTADQKWTEKNEGRMERGGWTFHDNFCDEHKCWNNMKKEKRRRTTVNWKVVVVYLLFIDIADAVVGAAAAAACQCCRWWFLSSSSSSSLDDSSGETNKSPLSSSFSSVRQTRYACIDLLLCVLCLVPDSGGDGFSGSTETVGLTNSVANEKERKQKKKRSVVVEWALSCCCCSSSSVRLCSICVLLTG